MESAITFLSNQTHFYLVDDKMGEKKKNPSDLQGHKPHPETTNSCYTIEPLNIPKGALQQRFSNALASSTLIFFRRMP